VKKYLFILLLFMGLSATLELTTDQAWAQGGAGAAATSEDAEGQPRTLTDWYAMGGWIMHGIVGCSMLTVGLVLERFWALRRSAIIPAVLLRKLHETLKKHDLTGVLKLCSGSDTSLARVMRAGLIHFDQGLGPMQDAVDTAGSHEGTLLRRNLPMLAALANVATMMGLLGTVLGMIESFQQIAIQGTGDASIVAGGIFEALVTTAFGLMVGISAIAAHSVLRRRVEVMESELAELTFGMLEDVVVHRVGEPSAAPDSGGLAPQGV